MVGWQGGQGEAGVGGVGGRRLRCRRSAQELHHRASLPVPVSPDSVCPRGTYCPYRLNFFRKDLFLLNAPSTGSSGQGLGEGRAWVSFTRLETVQSTPGRSAVQQPGSAWGAQKGTLRCPTPSTGAPAAMAARRASTRGSASLPYRDVTRPFLPARAVRPTCRKRGEERRIGCSDNRHSGGGRGGCPQGASREFAGRLAPVHQISQPSSGKELTRVAPTVA